MSDNRLQVIGPIARFLLSPQFLGWAIVAVAALPQLSEVVRAKGSAKAVTYRKLVIGPTADVVETESNFTFSARVDTGATTSSLHVEAWKVEDEAPVMAENVGKTIRFCLRNQDGATEWLERKIAEISLIKTSEQEEQRYKVRMTLNCLNVKKRVLVSLNDRSKMNFPVLLGRNFLKDDFVVDVALEKRAPGKSRPTTPRQKKLAVRLPTQRSENNRSQ